MTTPEEWKEKRIKHNKALMKNMEQLNHDQLNAVKEAQEAINNVMQSFYDCQDVWLSDIAKLDTAMWKLKNNFPTSEEN